MVTGDPAFFDTRAAALWDNDNLYIAFWVEEPFVEAHLTERDSLIFMENDVEVFMTVVTVITSLRSMRLTPSMKFSSSGRMPINAAAGSMYQSLI
jgi:hypothetical protein